MREQTTKVMTGRKRVNKDILEYVGLDKQKISA